MRLSTRRSISPLPALLACACVVAGCKGPAQSMPAPPPVDVTAMLVTARDTPVAFEYVGQTESSRPVEIRARVDGYLQKRFYEEGSIVRAGAPLFQIDPSQRTATLENARAGLQQAQSRLLNTQQTVARFKPLLSEEAVSAKDFDDALAAEKSAAAALESAKADLRRAELDLGYARLESPLTGLAGRAAVAEGSYVNPAQNGLLTTVAQLDPINVNFSLSENAWLSYAEEIKKGTLRFPKASSDFAVELILSDGTVLPAKGKLNFSSQTVDPQTGSYTMRAVFPNADLLVRPGQIVRVRVLGAVRPNALMVPQRAVLQSQKGKFVYVVGSGGKAEARPVEVGDWYADQWMITAGLKSGEQVLLDGTLKVQPGALVKVAGAAPAPAGSPGKAAAP